MAKPRQRGRAVAFLTGLFLIAIGIPMLVCPGPGLASIAAGLGLLGFAVTGKRKAEELPALKK